MPYDRGPNSAVKGKNIEPIFHPQLRRTKEVIQRPEWVRRAGEAVAHRGSLNALALFGILFSNCVGGGYGFEDGIGAAGPLITLIVCVLLPWIWCLPTGLAVAELSTAVPSNSGVLMWTNAAFPPFISFLCIVGTMFITFIGNATYPNLTAEYVSNVANINAGEVAAVKIAVVVVCCVLNCVGVEIVGSSSFLLCIITLLPFSLLTVIQLFGHGFNKAVLHVNVHQVDWAGFFSIISWNYANIENAGAVVEEVANPRRALPRAMVLLMISTYAAYVMPMLAGVSAMGVGQDYSQWQAGHWPEVAMVVAGPWLKYMLFAGAILSGTGFTLTSMCCTSRLLAGMGTMQMFPRRVSRLIGYYHPRLGTPIPAILLNSLVTLTFSLSMDFGSVVALCQCLYCLRMLLIYAALIKLRIEYPKLARPYALPCSTKMAALCLLPAALFSIFAAVVSAMTSLAIGIALVAFLVGGSALSWVYCRLFARNGFQGVIVQCAVTDEDDDEVSATEAPPGEDALSEGVFYHDGQADQPGDLLLGILPLTSSPTVNGNAATMETYLAHDGSTGLGMLPYTPTSGPREGRNGSEEAATVEMMSTTVNNGHSGEDGANHANGCCVEEPDGMLPGLHRQSSGTLPYRTPPNRTGLRRRRAGRNTTSGGGGGVTGEESSTETDDDMDIPLHFGVSLNRDEDQQRNSGRHAHANYAAAAAVNGTRSGHGSRLTSPHATVRGRPPYLPSPPLPPLGRAGSNNTVVLNATQRHAATRHADPQLAALDEDVFFNPNAGITTATSSFADAGAAAAAAGQRHGGVMGANSMASSAPVDTHSVGPPLAATTVHGQPPPDFI